MKPSLKFCSEISEAFEENFLLVDPTQPIPSPKNNFVSSFISPAGQTFTRPGLTHDELTCLTNELVKSEDLNRMGFLRVYRGDPGSWSTQNVFGVEIDTHPTEAQLVALQSQFDAYPSYRISIYVPGFKRMHSIAELREALK